MRAFTDMLRFELRLHSRSPFFWGVALLFFALHLLTLTRTGINLGDNEQIAINSAWLIFQTETRARPVRHAAGDRVRGDRDDARPRTPHRGAVLHDAGAARGVPAGPLFGRNAGRARWACAGVLGALAGTFMPWLDPDRIAPFDWRPWAASLAFARAAEHARVLCAVLQRRRADRVPRR